jgi:hypothetical protein
MQAADRLLEDEALIEAIYQGKASAMGRAAGAGAGRHRPW